MTSVVRVISVAPIGFDAKLVEVECDIKNGLPSLQIVGLGNKAIDEAKERVRSAIPNSLLDFPAKRVLVNLAPAELPKDGSHYDLPIALSILAASGQLRSEEVNGAVFAAELALSGDVRPIRGVISIVEAAKNAGLTTVYLPAQNAAQAVLIDGLTIIPVTSLKEIFLHLKGEKSIAPYSNASAKKTISYSENHPLLDDIYAQEQAKRALTIAAAGRHNILFSGTPGAGKTMLAKALIGLLPELSTEEQVAVTKLHSLSGESIDEIVTRRPFRTPHHTSSRTALIGGGSKPKPGEISLAHLGVLFLDEIPEYPRATLEALRQPLEDKKIVISRANERSEYPADFMLVATMNPCPCGYYGDSTRECTCTSTQILNYQKRLSGPLLDRIDMVVNVNRVATNDLLFKNSSHNSQQKNAYDLIEKATSYQFSRYKSSSKYNSNVSSQAIAATIIIQPAVKSILDAASEKLQLSARSYFKIIKLARTIADMSGAETIAPEHVAEALQYRLLTS